MKLDRILLLMSIVLTGLLAVTPQEVEAKKPKKQVLPYGPTRAPRTIPGPTGCFCYPGIGIDEPVGYALPSYNERTRFMKRYLEVDNTEKAIAFLEAGAVAGLSDKGFVDTGSDTYNPLIQAVDNQDTVFINAVHRKNPRAIRFSQTLHHACATSDTTMIRFLIDRYASPDLWGRVSTWSNVHVTWKTVYPWNSDWNYPGLPIDCALRSRKMENVAFLMENYDSHISDVELSTELVGYLQQKDQEGVDFIMGILESPLGKHTSLKNVCNTMSCPGFRTSLGSYPLIEAIRAQNKELARKMIEEGADVNIVAARKDIFGGLGGYAVYHSPFYEAIRTAGMLDIIKLMLQHGARPVGLKDARSEYKEYFILNGIM